jgi:small subunit ribosomal protein S1
MATTTFPTRDDFAALLNESLGGENETFEGKVVKGTVTGIENDMAVIDVGLKSEGRVPLREFAAPGQKAELKIGDEVEVYVDRVENSAGEAMLSRDRARREAAWDKLEGEFSAGNRVEGVIFGRVKGGFTVDLGGAVVVPLDGVTVPLHRRVFWVPGQLAAAASPTRRANAPPSPRTRASRVESRPGNVEERPRGRSGRDPGPESGARPIRIWPQPTGRMGRSSLTHRSQPDSTIGPVPGRLRSRPRTCH